MDGKMTDSLYLVTVVVVTYNSLLKKTLMTLQSIMLQENIEYQIIIADDGSEDNYFKEIQIFLKKREFYNYKLVANKKNLGTVKNLISGIEQADGKYIKDLGSGDYLYGTDTLYRWVMKAEEERTSICFSDTVDYQINVFDKIDIIRRNANPNDYGAYVKGGSALREAYLLKNDICCGAAILVRTNVAIKYLREIEGKVIYAEDNMYRLMVYQGEPSSWFNNNSVLYEIGSGISTQKSKKWTKKIQTDWLETNKILYGWMNGKKFDKKLEKKMRAERRQLLNPIERYFMWGLHMLKKETNLRKTSMEEKKEYIKKLYETE